MAVLMFDFGFQYVGSDGIWFHCGCVRWLYRDGTFHCKQHTGLLEGLLDWWLDKPNV